jgi:hypothetical protein
VPPTPETPETVSRGGVTSHVTSQQAPPRSNVIDFPKEIGAPCMTRTCDLLVRRLMQVVYPVGSSMVYLTLDRRFYLVFGSRLFTDCSLFCFLVHLDNVQRTDPDFAWTELLRTTRLVRKAIKHAHCNEAWIRAGTRF